MENILVLYYLKKKKKNWDLSRTFASITTSSPDSPHVQVPWAPGELKP